jgi:hypothetical protein
MAKRRRKQKLGGDLEVEKYCFIKINNWETKCYSITTKTWVTKCCSIKIKS